MLVTIVTPHETLIHRAKTDDQRVAIERAFVRHYGRARWFRGREPQRIIDARQSEPIDNRTWRGPTRRYGEIMDRHGVAQDHVRVDVVPEAS